MIEWMKEWLDELSEWMSSWMNEWMIGCMSEWINNQWDKHTCCIIPPIICDISGCKLRPPPPPLPPPPACVGFEPPAPPPMFSMEASICIGLNICPVPPPPSEWLVVAACDGVESVRVVAVDVFWAPVVDVWLLLFGLAATCMWWWWSCKAWWAGRRGKKSWNFCKFNGTI